MNYEISLSHCVFGMRPPVEEDFRLYREFGIKYLELSILRGWLDPEHGGGVCREAAAFPFMLSAPKR